MELSFGGGGGGGGNPAIWGSWGHAPLKTSEIAKKMLRKK